jgi:hypothetical protein
VTAADGKTLVEAEPVTGRTHQIRVHAAAEGFPILGDTIYGGTPAARVCLHAEQLTFEHPVTHGEMKICALADLRPTRDSCCALCLIQRHQRSASMHGAADGCAGWYVDRLGDFPLSQSEQYPDSVQDKLLAEWMNQFSLTGVYHKNISRSVRETNIAQASRNGFSARWRPTNFWSARTILNSNWVSGRLLNRLVS